MTQPTESHVDPRILRALGHPVRQEMMISLCRRPASVNALARELDLRKSTVRRHFATLIANDAAEAVDGSDVPEDDRRYRAMIRPFLDDAHWERLPANRRQALFGVTLRHIARQIDRSLPAGGFSHAQTHVSFSRLLLDEQGWQEVTDLLAGVVEEVMEVEAECAQRRASGSADELSETNLAILHFGRADRDFGHGTT
jgi:DNA-binding transcriptional ArsR family regulator